MKDVALSAPALSGGRGSWRESRLLRVAILWPLMLGMMLVTGPEQFVDPFVRSDDYPGLVPRPDLYYHKTLTEGRWLNWVWMLRPWPTDPVLLNAVLGLCWSLTATFVATALAPGRGQFAAAALIALAVLFTPQQGFIWLWFNTLVPASVLLALFAGVAAFAPRRVAEWGLLVSGPLFVLTYPSYALVAMVLVLGMSGPDPSPLRALRVTVLAGTGIALGLLASYTLNWMLHGHFGIVLPSWRMAEPLESLADLPRNLTLAVERLALVLPGAIAKAHMAAAAGTAVLALCFVMLARAAPRRAWAMGLALAVCIGLPLLHMVKVGAAWPFRATLHIHFAFVVLLALAYLRCTQPARRALAALMLVLLAVFGQMAFRAMMAGKGPDYQAETWDIAERIETVEPRSETVVIAGRLDAVPGGDFIQNSYGVTQRLALLTGAEVQACAAQPMDEGEHAGRPQAPELLARPYLREGFREMSRRRHEVCERFVDRAAALPVWPAAGHVAAIAPGVVGLRLPDEVAEPEDHPAAP